MTYNEWRDELKNNLLTVTDAERRRVLDYYAEAYADRREAGFTEREIIEGFGAPYDAAQRILAESSDDYYQEPRRATQNEGKFRKKHATNEENRHYEREEKWHESENHAEPQAQEPTVTAKPVKQKSRDDYTWVFVLLCIIFAIPIFCAVATMFGITVGLCAAPFGVLFSGLTTVVMGIDTMINNLASGALMLGEGLIVIGVGIIAFPLCFKLVKWMWKLFNMFFRWLKGLFSGKERVRNE